MASERLGTVAGSLLLAGVCTPVLVACSAPPRPAAEPPALVSVSRATTPAPPAAPVRTSTLVWRRLTPPGSLGASFAKFVNFSPGAMVAAGLSLQRSTDGGRTWQAAMNGIGEEQPVFRGIVFAGSRWLTITERELYASDDDGVTWAVVTVPGVPTLEAGTPRGWQRLKRQRGTTYLASGSLLFESSDEGRTWTMAPGPKPFPALDGLAITKRGVWAYADDGHQSSFAFRRKGAQEWRVPRVPTSEARGDRVRGFGAAAGALYLALRDEMLVSRDEGSSWRRLKYTGDMPWSGLRDFWELPNAALATDAMGLLYRVTLDGATTRLNDGRVRALAVNGNDIVALTTTHVIGSNDGGRTFREERPSGLGSDSINAVSASGKQIAVVAFGPTAHVTDDGGKTWWPGPELGHLCDGVVAGKHAFLFYSRERVGSVLWRATSATGSWARVPLPDGLTASLELLGADGATIAIASGVTAYLTRDAGEHWTSLGTWPMPLGLPSGLVRGNEVFSGGLDGIVRSVSGTPFEDVTRHFLLAPPGPAPEVTAFFHDGDTTFAVASEGLYGWDRAHDRALSLTARLPLGTSVVAQKLEHAAVDGSRLLLVISGATSKHLVLSRDLGRTWVDVQPPLTRGQLGPVAHADAGFLLGQRGLWAEGAE